MKDTSLYPCIRFSEYQNEWQKSQLQNSVILISGQHLSPDQYDTKSNENPYFTGPSDFTNDVGKLRKWSLVESKLAECGDILITVKGSGVGEMMMLGLPKVAIGRQLMAIRSGDNVNNNFIHFRLQKNKKLFEALASGNLIPGLSRPDILQTKIYLPCKKEQQKIADFLSGVDKKISLLEEKHTLLEQYKKGVMQKLFSQEIRFKDKNGNDFPDWEKGTLGDLSNKVSNKNKDESVTAVLTNSAKSGIVNQTDYFKKDIANENNLGGYSIVEKDDFVYNPRISVLAPVGPIKRNHVGQGVMSPLYTVFRFKDDNIFDYLELYFETTQWHRYMNSIANFGARHDRMNITMGDFFNLPIPIPSQGEMVKIVGFIQALNKKVNAVSKQIEHTQTFKKGLLQQMFV